MKFKRLDHIGIVVEDLDAAVEFFLDFGMKNLGGGEHEGEWLGEIVGLKNPKTAFVVMGTTDGEANIELIKYYEPVDSEGIQPKNSNALGLRNICFEVEDLDAVIAKLETKGSRSFGKIQEAGGYRMVYCRGPEGIILMAAEQTK